MLINYECGTTLILTIFNVCTKQQGIIVCLFVIMMIRPIRTEMYLLLCRPVHAHAYLRDQKYVCTHICAIKSICVHTHGVPEHRDEQRKCMHTQRRTIFLRLIQTIFEMMRFFEVCVDERCLWDTVCVI